ncbi:cytidylyltransferase domain-containing protein, partial [Candidatus Pelagibacter sp.]|uniref:cytidylyltransferase domain-containing protein n=1 Tax=Candidatus Pelagibacter sp. TaxID=2024849 RepID=UPI003F8721C8
MFYIFVQARMSSKRLPGKVLLKLGNKTVLGHIVDRIKKIKNKKKIIILTSNNKSDDKIIKFCKKKKINFFRGDLNNVYKRYIQAIRKFNNEMFVRINGDSPLIKPSIVDKAKNIYKKNKFDIITNCMIRTFPKGQSVEIINSKIFLESYKFLRKKEHKEHIFLYFYKNKKKY